MRHLTGYGLHRCIAQWAQILLLALSLSQGAAAGMPPSGDDQHERHRSGVLSSDEIVAATGKSIEEWGAEWWTWAFANPDVIGDQTGEFGPLGDVRGPVFFAEGSVGLPVSLHYTVPGGKYLLVPVATYIWTLFDPCAEVNCARRIINKNFIADTADVVARIDGLPVHNMRSHLVKVDHTPNVFLVDAGPIGEDGYGGIMSALQGGYWLMLEPLAPGPHHLVFGATVPDLDPFTGQPTGGTLKLDATLDLVVQKPKSCHPHRHEATGESRPLCAGWVQQRR